MTIDINLPSLKCRRTLYPLPNSLRLRCTPLLSIELARVVPSICKALEVPRNILRIA
jgi:hypothetical protein